MVLLGTSLGGTIALDFALAHPEAVQKLVLVDAQGFIDGLGPLGVAPRWLATLGVRVRQILNAVESTTSRVATQWVSDSEHALIECTVLLQVLRSERLRQVPFIPAWLDDRQVLHAALVSS